jgi:hypothetical protein
VIVQISCSSRRFLSAVAVVVAVSAVALALVGCGGSRASSTPESVSTPTPKATGASDASKESPHVQFASFARAVNLRAQDVPGFSLKPHERRESAENEKPYARCLRGLVEVKPLAKYRSRKFVDASSATQVQQVGSSVEIAPTVAIARKELAQTKRVLANARSRECLAGAFDTLGLHQGSQHVEGAAVRTTVDGVHVVPITVSAATRGTDGGVGLSMSLDVTYVASVSGRSVSRTVPLAIDVLAFLLGRAGVNLQVMSVGRPFPPERESKLFAGLVSRATAVAREYPALTS